LLRRPGDDGKSITSSVAAADVVSRPRSRWFRHRHFNRPSASEYAEGYFLTRALMNWFWDLNCSPADRRDPRAAPIRGN